MKKLIVIILMIAASFVGWLKADNASQHAVFDQSDVVTALNKIDVARSQLYLYSLDPINRQPVIHEAPNFFHGYPILGRVEIKPVAEKKRLFKAFINGVAESEGMEANCFDPRHGIRLIRDGKTTDFVVCYECLSVAAYGFDRDRGFLTGGSPKETFNSFLDQYHLKKAPSEP